MKTPLSLFSIRSLAGAALLQLAAFSNSAHADFTFNFTGASQTITLDAGTYGITAWGAQGGASPVNGFTGGLGAEMGGIFTFSSPTTLSILVGGQGTNGITGGGGGGGGGSFVAFGNEPLLIAGGGGGGSQFSFGNAGLIGTSGGKGSGTNGAGGGAGGSGGGGGLSIGGGGGGGFSGDGAGIGGFSSGAGGLSFGRGGAGGVGGIGGANPGGRGGFGGGGGGTAGGAGGGAGGGGGYSGGGGGGNRTANNAFSGGGGGGSFLTPSAVSTLANPGVRSGNGRVTINVLTVPEPSTALFGLALCSVASLRRRR